MAETENVKGKATTKTGLKWKKKKWYEILAPAVFQNKAVGETFAEEPQNVIGRVVVTNLLALQGNIKKQNLNISLKVESVKGDKAVAVVKDFHMQKTSVRKIVRKAISKIEDSFACKTKDGQTVRIKLIGCTRTITNGGVLAAVRKMMRQWCVNRTSELSFNDAIRELTDMKFQKDLKTVLDRIYPLKVCQVRYFGLVSNIREKIIPIAPLPLTRSKVAGSDEKKAEKKQLSRKRKVNSEDERESAGSEENPEAEIVSDNVVEDADDSVKSKKKPAVAAE